MRQCSFCHSSESEHGVKLISNPEEYPRAFICDLCVALCASMLEDDREIDPQSFLKRGLASQLQLRIEQWITREASSQDASDELAQLRALARQMFINPDA